MIWAMGLAATQAAGLREMFGSMAKAFHPGRSAQNGYTAALLAQADSLQVSARSKVHEDLQRCRRRNTTCRKSPRGSA
jgi:2-methylcitrate dehydratase PrpD